MLNEKYIKITTEKLICPNYSENTINNYISHIYRFLKYFNKQVIHFNSYDFREYLIKRNSQRISVDCK
jgi:site-specific recombinase XerD